MLLQKRAVHVSAAALVLVTVLVALLMLRGASATQIATHEVFLYSVKFTCVPEVGSVGDDFDAAFQPAEYRTAINVHNFHDTDVRFDEWGVIARGQNINGDRGKVSDTVTESLGAGEAVDITCDNLHDLFAGTQPVGNGMLLLQSDVELNVVAVYTAQVRDIRLSRESVVAQIGPPGGFPDATSTDPPPDAVPVDPTTGEPESGGAIGVGFIRLFPDPSTEAYVGAGNGLGLGVGAGTSIDVEYIEPRVMRVATSPPITATPPTNPGPGR